jgi:signal transduction histidine kinase
MPIELLKAALAATGTDEAVVRELLQVWPLVESVLETFSRATKLPIFAYLYGRFIFQSSTETMPAFCALMLSNPETSTQCKHDGLRRAMKEEPDVHDRVQYCHAGQVNGRREIETGLAGTLTVLFGAKPPDTADALSRRKRLVQAVDLIQPDLAIQLRDATAEDNRAGIIEISDSTLMDAITEIVQRLLRATVSAQAFAINMAHELSLPLLSMGLLATSIEGLVSETPYDAEQQLNSIVSLTAAYRHLLMECKLALYVVRNFLSHTSETRYSEVVKPHFILLNLAPIVEDMIELYEVQAAKRQIVLDVSGLGELPSIYADENEIRRLLHNILNNAVKYSYHGTARTHRTIRIRARVPYDPGFRERRFAIVIENYGLGLGKDERGSAFQPGFRGRQASREVPTGAGIGLSEAAKIMKMHHGTIRLRSEELHLGALDSPTFLTTVELIFSYPDRSKFLAAGHAPLIDR